MNRKRYITLSEDITTIKVEHDSRTTLRNTGEKESYLLLCSGSHSLELTIEKGADVTLIEASDSTPEFRYEIHLESGASLRHIRIDLTDKKTSYTLHQERDSRYELSLISLCGSQENSFAMHSDGEGTDTRMCGFTYGQASYEVRNTIRLYHHKPHATSYQAFKYVADDASRLSFDGKIIVDPHAQKIEAYQKNNNILLNEKAHIESDPQLEIYADDVRCSHGSTIGQLDADALFYMQSRGINYMTACGILIRSFADEPLSMIKEEWLREQIEDIIASMLK
ncbi:MAG: SufD family Fe-S cluster assembly protein [Flavobacteriales bacterium]|nr:SufD family Fe-S cluster assembly protein [Flavobacteriales bacterium]